ncbi:MAG TPA: efflux RND transporter periplasmic adaptor subunit [Candidatus Eisenbacteria bacterium]|nr:efflux RND transporter periplasmic adaptor subunit [Candidatus Eisenbacteria bacterium]
MKRWIARAGLLALLAVAALVGCSKKESGTNEVAAPAAAGTPRQIGPFQVSVANRPGRPVVGDNILRVAVRDSAGRPLRGATLTALVSMPAMGAMPRMESRGDFRETKPGVYEATYGLPMQGDWDAALSIRASDGREVEAVYRISTNQSEVTFVEGTGAPGASSAAADVDAVTIDPSRRQAIGIRTGPVTMQDLTVTIRAAGRITYDETRRAEISLKFSGWVRDIRVDYVGRQVRQGEILLTVYSPELLSAQQEYLEALNGGAGSSDLAAAARQRLSLWDIDPATLDAIAASGKAMEKLPILAPVSGVVVEKNVVAGSSFTAGQTLYKIAPIHPVWVIANVFQYELPLVRVGMAARILTPFPGEPSRMGRVSNVNPFLDPETRTGEVRAVAPNPRGDLKPGMFVDVVLERRLGRRLAIPESAVLYSGDRRVVFVDLGDGRLAPRDVRLGAKAGDQYEVVGGLHEGEIVVISGNFLVAAEARLRSATGQW